MSEKCNMGGAKGCVVRAFDSFRGPKGDTGVGIAPEDLPRVCEPGFTGVNGRADKRATGLGLYLTRRTLCGLGHGLTIESAPGKGTTAAIDLSTRRLEGE